MVAREGRGRGRREGEGEGEGEGEVTDIKSNNPHLTGGEKHIKNERLVTDPESNSSQVAT